MPEARVPFTITRSTSALVWYSTPNLRPTEIKASEMAWVPPIAIAAGSNDSTSDRLWARPCSPGVSSPKQPVEVVAARINNVRNSSDSKKS